MILIADSGSTKTNWCLVNRDKKKDFFNTEGYNPYYVDSDYIVSSLQNCVSLELSAAVIKEVHFYGAGCVSSKSAVVQLALEKLFHRANVRVELDLLASARALLGNIPGFVAILGTGSNTCLYDGQEVAMNIDSLGFLMGDEGSGADLGKRLLSDYMRGYLPKALEVEFIKTYQLSPDQVMDRIYGQPLANRFCAGFSTFLSSHIKHPYAAELVKDAFCRFFSNLVSRYPDYTEYSFNCIGSVGFAFKDILMEVAADYDMETGRIIKSPIDSLVDFHAEGLFTTLT
jgi:glucosamine kinase